MARRPAQPPGSQDKRRAILRAAVRVFARNGYEASRVADIAKEAFRMVEQSQAYQGEEVASYLFHAYGTNLQFAPGELIDAEGAASGAEALKPLIEAVRHERRELSRTVGYEPYRAIPLMGLDNAVLGEDQQ